MLALAVAIFYLSSPVPVFRLSTPEKNKGTEFVVRKCIS
jgi:hypothetical protein